MVDKLGNRTDAKIKICIIGKDGPVAQLLHPLGIAHNDIAHMSIILQMVDEQLSSLTSEVKLVVSGGGFIQIDHAQTYDQETWRSEQIIDELTGLVQEKMRLVATALKGSSRDFVIGVDISDNQNEGNGQFAVLLGAGEIKTIAWKSFPYREESEWLAGFGSAKGRNSPRIASTVLGKVILLVCHDAQAYNHRTQALVGRAHLPTPRKQAIDSMMQTMRSERPEWAFSLIHRIDKEGSIKPFRNSYNQIHQDYGVPAVVGAFGYDKNFRAILERLANRTQYPDGKAAVVAILEVS